MDEYSAETFEPYLGQVFVFEGPVDAQGRAAREVQLELVEVARGRGRPAPGMREPFSLLFVLKSEAPLGNGLHRIVHDDFVPCEWFVNRVAVLGRDPRVPHYQAVFG